MTVSLNEPAAAVAKDLKLWLVEQASTTTINLTPNQPFVCSKSILLASQVDVLCAAIETFTYSSADTVRVYISKLDTTGVISPRNAQRPLLQYMLNRLMRALIVRHGDKKAVHLHVLARSNPEYLFPGSQALEGKRSVKGRKLVYWWRDMLDRSFVDDSLKVIRKFWFIPGVDLPSKYTVAAGGDNGWEYQYVAGGGGEDARDDVFMFEGDPVATVLERTLSGDQGKISTSVFINDIIPRSTDFCEGACGIFVAELKAEGDSAKVIKGLQDDEVFDRLQVMFNLKTGDIKPCSFATDKDLRLSSQKIIEVLQDGEPFDLPFTPRVTESESRPVAVNVLQVKRRKVEK